MLRCRGKRQGLVRYVERKDKGHVRCVKYKITSARLTLHTVSDAFLFLFRSA